MGRVLARVLAVDGHSMFYAQQKVGWFFDPSRLLALAGSGEEVELTSAFWYAGLKDPTDQRPFRDALTGLGYTVRTKPLRELPSGSDGEPQRHFTRANLDVEIAIDLISVADTTYQARLPRRSLSLCSLVDTPLSRVPPPLWLSLPLL